MAGGVALAPAASAADGGWVPGPGDRLIYDPCANLEGTECSPAVLYTARDSDGTCNAGTYGLLTTLGLWGKPRTPVVVDGQQLCQESNVQGGYVMAGPAMVGSLTEAAAVGGQASIPAAVNLLAGGSRTAEYGSSGLRWVHDATTGALKLVGGVIGSSDVPAGAAGGGFGGGGEFGEDPETGMPVVGIFPEDRLEFLADRDAAASGLGLLGTSRTMLVGPGTWGQYFRTFISVQPEYDQGALIRFVATADMTTIGHPGDGHGSDSVYRQNARVICADGTVAGPYSNDPFGSLPRSDIDSGDRFTVTLGAGYSSFFGACVSHGGGALFKTQLSVGINNPVSDTFTVPLDPGAIAGLDPAELPSPERVITVNYRCGADERSVSVSYTEAGLKQGSTWSFPSLPCEAGAPSGVTVDQRVGWAEPVRIAEIDDPDPDMADAVSGAAAGAPAVLDLGVTTGGTTTSCFDDPALCTDWIGWDAPSKDALRCTYGGVAVSLDHCNVYGPLFVGPGAPAEYGDPQTGSRIEVESDPDGDGSGNPGTGTGVGIPLEGENPADPDTGSCMGSGWSWNPVSWVLVPIKCALLWAFVPDAEQLASAVAPFRNGYESSSLAAWLNAATGSVAGVSGDAGGPCAPWIVDYPMAGGGTEPLTVVDPCSGPMATAAGVSRVVSTVLLVVLGGWACVRVLLGAGLGIRVGVAEGASQS